MWERFQPNPAGRNVGDCAVRAIAKALETDWDTAYARLVLAGFHYKDLPSANSVWGAVLRQHGFAREAIPNTCPDCYTAAEFAAEHPRGTFVLVFSEGTVGHVATVKDGNLYDSFDSSDCVPQYYFYRKDE